MFYNNLRIKFNYFVYLIRIGDDFCEFNATSEACQTYTGGSLRCINAFPGIKPEIIKQNLLSNYFIVNFV